MRLRMCGALFHLIIIHVVLINFSQLKAPRKMCGPFKLSSTQSFRIVLLPYVRYWNFITCKFLKFFSFATPPHVIIISVFEYYFSRCGIMMSNIAKDVEMAIKIIYELHLIYIFQSLLFVLCGLTVVESPSVNHSMQKFKFASYTPQITLFPSPRIS